MVLSEAVSNLRNEFERVQEHLDWLVTQVQEMASVDNGFNAISCQQQLQDLRRRINIVAKKRGQIVKKRQGVMKELVKVTLRNHELLNRIRGQCQMATSGIPENVLEDFAETASCFEGNPLSPGGSSGASPDASMVASKSPPPQPKRAPAAPKPPGNKRRRPASKGSSKGSGKGNGPAARGKKRKSDQRRGAGGSPRKKKPKKAPPAVVSCGITEEMFEAIPQYTRGRVKLASLNEHYRKLHAIYLEDIPDRMDREPMTFKQLGAKGLKLTSASGKNILNCFRSLKLVTVKSNHVTLVEPFRPPLP